MNANGVINGFIIGNHGGLVRVILNLSGFEQLSLVLGKKLAKSLHHQLGNAILKMEEEEERKKLEEEERKEKEKKQCPFGDPNCIICKMFNPEIQKNPRDLLSYKKGEEHPNCRNLTSAGNGVWERRLKRVECSCNYCRSAEHMLRHNIY